MIKRYDVYYDPVRCRQITVKDDTGVYVSHDDHAAAIAAKDAKIAELEAQLPKVHDLRVNPVDLPDTLREVLLLRELKNGRRYIQKGEYLHGGESDEIGDWEDDDYRDHPSDGNVWLPEGWYAYCDDDYDPKWIGDKSDVIAWQELPVWDGAE
jgi:hypothetical protein